MPRRIPPQFGGSGRRTNALPIEAIMLASAVHGPMLHKAPLADLERWLGIFDAGIKQLGNRGWMYERVLQAPKIIRREIARRRELVENCPAESIDKLS